MKRLVSDRKLLGFLVGVTVLAMVSGPVHAVTDAEIQDSIDAGIQWLVDQQNSDGSWGSWSEGAITAFALVKLQDRAIELGLDPFETDDTDPKYYEYASNVIAGWEYLFTPGSWVGQYVRKRPVVVQPAGDPDSNGNGYGITLWDECYETGIFLMALASSQAPDRANDGGLDFNGDSAPDTLGEIAKEVTDWLAYAQVDTGDGRGAWGYSANGSGDNSVSGYTVLGLAAAEGFGCTVPDWVKDELQIWIDYIQCTEAGDSYGGCGYYWGYGPCYWVNELKTGNLIFQMTFCGSSPGDLPFHDALVYMESHWHDNDLQPGWGYGMGAPAHYQAMYCLMKGLEYSQIDFLDLTGDSTADDDWFDELATVLVGQQEAAGNWPSSPCYVWPGGSWGVSSGAELSTIWALLTLERVTPPPPVINVSVDIKPTSCPNPFNMSAQGVLPIAILGTEDFDVSTIDPVSVLLEGVPPIRSDLEDVATPFSGELCDCHTLGPDGYQDLTLKYDMQAVAAALGDVEDGEVVKLMLVGFLRDSAGGTPIQGADCIVIRKKGK